MYYQQNNLMTNSVYCVLEEGIIYQVDFMSKDKVEIGVTNATHNEVLNTLDEYYNKLVELGEIEKEKTPEEKEKEQVELINTMLTEMKSLKDEIKELKNNESKSNNTNGTKGSTNDGSKRPK